MLYRHLRNRVLRTLASIRVQRTEGAFPSISRPPLHIRSRRTTSWALLLSAATALVSVRTIHADNNDDLQSEDPDALEPSPDKERDRNQSEFIYDVLVKDLLVVDIPEYGHRYNGVVVKSQDEDRLYSVPTWDGNPRWHANVLAAGHGDGGTYTCNNVRNEISAMVVNDLIDLLALSDVSEPSPADIDASIKQSFLRLDHIMVNQAAERALLYPNVRTIDDLVAAKTNASALLVLFDVQTRTLRVANTGGCRAVLGRRVKDAYEVHVLSNDHTLDNPDEIRRISSVHAMSDEGLSYRFGQSRITRMFGNGPLKWNLDLQQRLFQRRLGEPLRPDVDLPPATAEPEIMTTSVRPGDFLIFGSPQLWDALSNEEAVGLVGVWSDKYRRWWGEKRPEVQVVGPGDLPVILKKETDRTQAYDRWHAKKSFVLMDDIAAVHLARNALGGANKDLTHWLLDMDPSRAVKWRKDLSVGVIFFDEPAPPS